MTPLRRLLEKIVLRSSERPPTSRIPHATGRPLTHVGLLLATLTAVLLALTGCGNHQRDEVTTKISDAVARFNAGKPREGLAKLLGRTVDAATWRRGGEVARRLRNRAAVQQAETCAAQLESLAEAIELYRADDEYGQSLPENLGDLVSAGYLDRLPSCPSAGKDTCTASYRHHDGTYVLACKGQHHAAAGLANNSPWIDAGKGLGAHAPVARLWPRVYRLELADVKMEGGGARVALRERLSWPGQPEETNDLELRLVKDEKGWILGGGTAENQGLFDTLLAACAQPAPAADAAALEACHKDLQRVATALEMWSSDHDGAYPARLSQLVPSYLDSTAVRDGKPVYRVSGDRDVYELSCGGPHVDVHVSNATDARSALVPTVSVGGP